MPGMRQEEPISRMQSALTYPIVWATEKLVNAMPDWNDYGLGPEVYTALTGGAKDAANFTRHKHGLNLLDLPKHCLGFQNAYSVLNFAGGILKTTEMYTFRRNDNGLETPFEYASPTRTPTIPELQVKGEGSIDNELAIGGAVVKAMIGGDGRRGDFIRSKCIGEMTDMDATRIPDPSKYEPLVSGHEAWMMGQIGNRTLVATTANGQVYRYEAPSKWQKLETYTRMDLRYSFRNAPIEWLGLEKLNVFKGLPLQRMLMALAAGTIQSEQADYVSTFTPQNIPVRSDGIINPVARYMQSYQ